MITQHNGDAQRVRSIQILYVEDDPTDELALIRFLANAGHPSQITVARSLADAVARLNDKKFDIILADHSLSDGTGLSLLESFADRPIIFITGAGDETVAAQALRCGAANYIIKDSESRHLEQLPARINQALAHHRTRCELRFAQYSIQQSRDAMYWIDMNARIIASNHSASVMLGFTQDELAHMTVHDLNPATHADTWPAFWEDMKRRGSAIIHTQHKARDGRFVPVEVSVTFMEFDGVEYHCAIVRDVTRCNNMEQATRDATMRWEFAIENTGDGLWDWNLDTGEIFLSAQCKRLLGYDAADTISHQDEWESLIHPLDRPIALKEIHKLLRQEASSYAIEYRKRCKDGHYKWVLSRGQMFLPNASGSARHIIGAYIDISTHKQRDFQLTKQIEELTCLHQCGILMQKNLPTKELCQNVIDHLIKAMQFPSLAAFAIELGDTTFSSGNYNSRTSPSLSSPITIDGHAYGLVRMHYTEEQPFLIPYEQDLINNIAHLLGGWQARQKQQQAEQALGSQLQKFTQILNSAKDAIVSVNASYQIVLFNKSAESMFQYSASDVLGKSVNLLIPNQLRVSHTSRMDEFTKSGLSEKTMGHPARQVMALKSNGDEFPVEASISQSGEGEDVFYTVILRDISELLASRDRQARLQARLQEAQKLEALGTFSGGIAHDFNNLLTAIIGYGQMAEMLLEKDHPCRHYVSESLVASERAASLTKRLLAFSRGQALELTTIPLNHSIESFLGTLRPLFGVHINLVLNLDPAVGNIKLGLGQLEQILLNLCTNSKDAIEGSGSVEVSTAHVEEDEVSLNIPGSSFADSYATLTVRDTGSGMDENTKSRIFEPFFTTKDVGKGTGLGLSVVYGIMQQCGGKITVQSAPGKGTAFTLYFRRTSEKRPDQQDMVPSTQSAPLTLQKHSAILLVDDDPMIRVLARTILELDGYHVHDAPSADDALRYMQAFPEQTFNLLLTDVRMPKMNGREFANQIRTLHPNIPVLYMSGYSDDPVVTEEVTKGKSFFLAKPFRKEALLKTVQEILINYAGQATPISTAIQNRHRILIIEDDEQILSLLSSALTFAGYTVMLAKSGIEAISIATKQPPDLVVTDILMPDKDGLEVIKDLKRLQPGLPIIAMSGGGARQSNIYLDLALVMGATRVFPKPIQIQNFLIDIGSILRIAPGIQPIN